MLKLGTEKKGKEEKNKSLIFLFDTQKLSPSKLDKILFIYHVIKMFSFIFQFIYPSKLFFFSSVQIFELSLYSLASSSYHSKGREKNKGRAYFYSFYSRKPWKQKGDTRLSLSFSLFFFIKKVGHDWTLAQAIEFQELKILPKGIQFKYLAPFGFTSSIQFQFTNESVLEQQHSRHTATLKQQDLFLISNKNIHFHGWVGSLKKKNVLSS